MNSLIKKIAQIIITPLAMLFFQVAHAQPVVVPGFMAIESSYLEAPESGSHSTMAYFTISNLHSEPIVLLGASSEIFESASLNAPGHEAIESIVIQPRERLEMGVDGYHVHLDEIDDSLANGQSKEVTLLVRRGLEPLEEIEGQDAFRNAGIRSRDAGIPNEHDIVVHVQVGN